MSSGGLALIVKYCDGVIGRCFAIESGLTTTYTPNIYEHTKCIYYLKLGIVLAYTIQSALNIVQQHSRRTFRTIG